MENGNTQKLAERIARILESETQMADLRSIEKSLEKINVRLDAIESQIAIENSQSEVRSPQSVHPSQEKFLHLEELAVETTENLQTEKACPFEPTGKPCDHCAMCASRGF